MKKKKVPHPQGTVLYRSEENKMIGGVCGGLGEVFDVDPTIIRILFLIAFFFGGSGFLLYLILWLIIPTRSKVNLNASVSFKQNVEEMKDRAHELGKSFRMQKNDQSRQFFGLVIIMIGVTFLLGNFGYFHMQRFWPVVLIAFGLFFIFKHKNE